MNVCNVLHSEVLYHSALVEFEILEICHRYSSFGNLMAGNVAHQLCTALHAHCYVPAAGVEDLGVTGRGNASEIGTYVDKTMSSELSGNVIDLCPVRSSPSCPHPHAQMHPPKEDL